MNRIEFMTELAALLQDISVEERVEAMQYYNDYFDDAGQENEQRVIEELGNPVKVAAMIKADLNGQKGEGAEYRETGYADTRFEEKEMPADREYYKDEKRAPKSSPVLKVLLIIAIILFGVPIVIPVAVAVIISVFALVVSLFAVFLALVVASIAVVIAGVSVFCIGLISMIPEMVVGIAMIGAGLILTVLGIIATVGSVRLCIVVFPGIIRGIVWVCRRPFQGRMVA